jgi:hypothetical protein
MSEQRAQDGKSSSKAPANRFNTPRASQAGESSTAPAVMSAEDFLNSPKAQKLLEKHNNAVEKQRKKRQLDMHYEPVLQFVPVKKIPPPTLDGPVIQQPPPIEPPTPDPVRMQEIRAADRAAAEAESAARKAAAAKLEPFRVRQRQIESMSP